MKLYLRGVVAILLLQTVGSAYAQEECRWLPDNKIKQFLVQLSRASYITTCRCPDDVDSAGYRCGEKSAWSRTGGVLCSENDVSDTHVKEYKEYCAKKMGHDVFGIWPKVTPKPIPDMDAYHRDSRTYLSYIDNYYAEMNCAHLSDNEVGQLIIQNSRDSYTATCPCPDNLDSAGNRCGGRSAWSKTAGYAPLCYLEDVTPSHISAYKRSHCAGGIYSGRTHSTTPTRGVLDNLREGFLTATDIDHD